MSDGIPDRITQLRARWQNDPSSRIFLQLGEEYRHLGRVQEALAVLDAGLKEHPGYLSALVAKGRCLLELGDAAQARLVLERVVQQDATQMVANKLLVRAFLETGEPERAGQRLDLYTLLNDGDPEIEELRRRVVAMSRASRAPERQPTDEPAERPRMDRTETPKGAGAGPDVFDLRHGEPSRAADTGADVFPVEARVAEPPSGGAVPAGLRARGEGNGSEPFPDLDPAHSRALYLASLEAESIFSFGGAGVEPPAATATLGELYRRQGHLDEAERIFREVMAREPGNEAARHGLAALAALAEPAGGPLPAAAARRGDGRLDAAQLLAGLDQPRASAATRKTYLLQSYLRRLRQARRPSSHVP